MKIYVKGKKPTSFKNQVKPVNQYIQEAQRSLGTGNIRDSTVHIVMSLLQTSDVDTLTTREELCSVQRNQHHGGSTFLITGHVS